MPMDFKIYIYIYIDVTQLMKNVIYLNLLI